MSLPDSTTATQTASDFTITQSSDVVKAAKAAYDDAAANWCDHAYSCIDGCSILNGAVCPEGDALLAAENDAWAAYRAARYGEVRS